MAAFQKALFMIVCCITVGLVIDGLRTGGVWVRGGKRGEPGANWNSQKKFRDDSPVAYWLWMLFYVAASVFFAAMGFGVIEQ